MELDQGEQRATRVATAERIVPIDDPAERRALVDHLVDELTGYATDPALGETAFPTGDLVIDHRDEGLDRPSTALTMVGRRRLRHLAQIVEQAVIEGVPGDIVETGVWRGGASIMVRSVLATLGVTDRTVWVCDSFEGLPPPSVDYPADSDSTLHDERDLAVSLEQVRANFDAYGLLDDQVRFVKGWFRDSMPTMSVDDIAILRLDGDMYESTIDPLVHLYDRVVPGGWIVVDDYRLLECCQQAVQDFATERGLEPELESIDHVGVFWRKR